VAHYEPVAYFTVNDNRDTLSFRAYGQHWQFALRLSDVIENNANHFYGLLSGGTNLLSSFTLAPNYITGMIVTSNETFWLEARDPAFPLDLSIHKSSDIAVDPSMEELHCGEATIPETAARTEESASKRNMNKRGYKIVALVVDQFWLSPAYNPWYTIDATYGLMNDVNAVYANAGLYGQG